MRISHRSHEGNVGDWQARGGDGATCCVEDRAVLDFTVMEFLGKGLGKRVSAAKLEEQFLLEAVAWDAEVRKDYAWGPRTPSSHLTPLSATPPDPLEPPTMGPGVATVTANGSKEAPKPVAQKWAPGACRSWTRGR